MSLLKNISDFHFSSDFAKKSRILAVAYILVEILVLSIILIKYTEFNIFAVVTHSIFFLFGFMLIIKPALIVLWAVYFMIEGFALLWISESLLGLIFLLAGNFFFVKLDFFRTHKRYKIPSLILLFSLAIFLFYLKNGFKVQYSRIIDLIIGLLLCVSIFVLVHDDLKKYYTKKPIVNLKNFELTERQKTYVEGIIKGMPLKDIASSLYVSESVVKREIKTVYELFGVENHKEFVRFLNNHDVIL